MRIWKWLRKVCQGRPLSSFEPVTVEAVLNVARPVKCPVCVGDGVIMDMWDDGLWSEPVGCGKCGGCGFVWRLGGSHD